MSTARSVNFTRLCVAATFLSARGLVGAQDTVDAPPVVIPGSCKGVDFNRASLSSPVRVDIATQVDEFGTAVSTTSLAEVSNKALLFAVTASVMTCKFQPAIRQGKPASGTARQLYQFTAAVSAPPLARRPAITDVKGCAPSADDYPAASRQLNETGTTRVSFTVSPEGRLTAFGVIRSSGFLRLDFTALIKLAGCKFQAATSIDGTPTSASFEVEYVWKLE
jgi:TonB family protein